MSRPCSVSRALGRLTDAATFGDIVVGTATIEHDYRVRFVDHPTPCHDPDAELLRSFQAIGDLDPAFRVHFARIASGDGDIIETSRAREVHEETGAICVAWEGSGGARAARPSNRRFLELWGITDGADDDAATHYHENIGKVMPNVARLLPARHTAEPRLSRPVSRRFRGPRRRRGRGARTQHAPGDDPDQPVPRRRTRGWPFF
ncbi:MAG: 5'-methylthioadenosine/S-adenosylhomocysteine nucleosidase [Acidimicrobiia bacterium]|nr:5'-methylthioadenosine/S-adenosylhomocysteine nucleosidase [Acidimicrobiia bacterium]